MKTEIYPKIIRNLTQKFKFHLLKDRVRPICLPTNDPLRSRSFVGEQPFIAGWGRLEESGNPSNVLQQLQLPILKNSECKEWFRRKRKLISKHQFGSSILCAGHLNGGRDSCQGDR